MEQTEELKLAGLKVTGPRLKIFDLFVNSKGSHLSAEDIYRKLHASKEDIGLATIYRVLIQFEASGLLLKHTFEADRAVYELNLGDHHDHMVCLKCAKIHEFVDPVIERRQIEIAETFRFQVHEHTMVLYGLCEHCASMELSLVQV